MTGLKAIGAELAGLLIDDGKFAFSIVVWLVVCGLVLPRLGLPSALPPLILFAGLLLILAGSALKRAGRGS